jgi:hypothetical protein
MRCGKAQEFLSLEIDGVLPPDVTVDLQDHLDACADCRQYREDIQLGSRLLAATEPTLSDNFEWKLQLRLNQTLKETAGEVAYPWTDPAPDRWSWFRNFGAAAAMGLAAVLAVAVFFGPVGQPGRQADGPAFLASPTQEKVLGGDRLPLESRFNAASPLGRPVATGSPFQRTGPRTRVLDSGWSGEDLEDLRTIYRLKAENEKLGRMLFHTQRQLQLMRAQLDSTEENALDLHEERP